MSEPQTVDLDSAQKIDLIASRAVLVADVDQDAKPADLSMLGLVGQVVVGLKPDGTTIIKNPSPLAGKTEKTRMKWMMGLLESKASRGSIDATRAWLQQFRWNEEMKRGKAAQQVALNISGVVTVVDDLTSLLPSAQQTTPIAVARVGEKKTKPKPVPVGVARPKELPAGVSAPVVIDAETVE